MLIVVTYTDKKNYSHKNIELVDYGYDTETYQTVILPPVHPVELGAHIDSNLGEWVIE
jgi:hypothetical protein